MKIAAREDETRRNWLRMAAVTVREWFRNGYNYLKHLHLSGVQPDASHLKLITQHGKSEWSPTVAEWHHMLVQDREHPAHHTT